MLKWVWLAVGLWSAPVRAADIEGATADPALALWQDPAAAAASAKSDAEQKREERLKALEDSQSTKASRVVVLKWPGQKETDHTSETLIRSVKTRIARPDAKFYPEVDLYQAGRKMPDRTIRPIDQKANVPTTAIPFVLAAIDDVTPIPWNAMSESDWGIKAHGLKKVADENVWFIDRPELREPLFKLYVQIGRAAENTNNPAPPFYAQVEGYSVNWYWYLAGAMAHIEPELMSKLTDQDLYGSIDYYKQLLDSKQIAPMTLAFEQEDVWDVKDFASTYQVFINGIEVLIDDKDSLYQVPPGRVDVYLKRDDGHSLSDGIDITKLQDKIYFVRDVARKKMGIDFIDQLMEHPNECSPKVDGDILNYLSIYAKLHPEADIYIAVPEAGNPNRVLIWRWDRANATLQKVLDNTGGFPIRFAVLGGTGMNFAGFTLETEYPEGWVPGDPAPAPQVSPGLVPAGLPFNLQLRLHYGRAIVIGGVNATWKIGTEMAIDPATLAEVEVPAKWRDYYQTDGNGVIAGQLKERVFSRTMYGGLGVMLMKDAAIGVGPRGYIQVGGTNVPHALDMTLHAGLTTKGPIDMGNRVRTLIDVDFFGGVQLPMAETVYTDETGKPTLFPLLGLNAMAGITF